MQLTLVLPNLLDAPPAALVAADAPALARLLSTAEAPILEPNGPLAIACVNLGIAKQNDWPVAPWLVRAAGIDPGSRYWLCAEPVTLDVGRAEVRLAGVVGDLDAADSIALLSSLRAHFASDGIEFLESGPGSWWVALAEPPITSALVWLDALDAPDLQEQLIRFDTDWAAPLERALDKHELDVRLVIAGSGTALSFTPHAGGAMQRLRRRWSPPPSLPALLAALADA